MKMKNKIIFLLFFVAICFLPAPLNAATLSFQPSAGRFGLNSVFELKVKLSLESQECVNAAQIEVNFPQDVLEISDFNTGDSIFSLWIEKPEKNDFKTINQVGKISFIGGLPGGYCGKIPEGQALELSAVQAGSETVASLIFSVKKSTDYQEANIGFSSLSQALLNNGQGTPAELKFENAHLNIEKNLIETKNEWQEKLAQDKTPPENFTIEVGRNEKIFDGQYFLAFAAIDKQTGIDHYEVLEVLPEDLPKAGGAVGIWKKIFNQPAPELKWVIATSPYLLKDQTLKSVFKIKAIDKAGNERIVEYGNNILRAAAGKNNFYLLMILASIGAIVTLAVFSAYLFVKRKKKCEK